MKTFLVIGLGNPGQQYLINRHNIGFMAIDVLNAQLSVTQTFKTQFKAQYFEAKINQHKIYGIKPQTFMNLSGQSVSLFSQFYKIPPEQIIVIHDDLDLDLGIIKIKQGGGHGGHNGLKNIDSLIGKDYWRIRIGIGHPGHKDLVSSYVLSNFKAEEINHFVEPIISDTQKILSHFLDTLKPTTLQY
ncbi:MAG: aminoacyl-tRNA hydrolase [Candidatus Puniceispirillum sp.]|nr:aminoacyl-tRNA hydrolase [Candidatus Pelagibacter sp.]MBA4283308.1 aminoacyl-tRNA hydrolase [Candidatus Puniceispirillum sp.]